jgi:hypothetical protein
MDEFMRYFTPAILMLLGVFVGRTNSEIKALTAELRELKRLCPRFGSSSCVEDFTKYDGTM